MTDDAIRSLAISQMALGTTEIVLVHHNRLRDADVQGRRPQGPDPSRHRHPPAVRFGDVLRHRRRRAPVDGPHPRRSTTGDRLEGIITHPNAAAQPTAYGRQVQVSLLRQVVSPFIPHKNVRGFVFEVETGKLREVA